MGHYDKASEAAAFIKDRFSATPEVGLILGSGLSSFGDSASNKIELPFDQIPHFKKVTISGHYGKLALGEIQNRTVVIMQGRNHFYEGHDIADVVFPTRTLCMLGIKTLILTNSAGGIDSSLSPGNLMIITDHINLMGINPLRGENDDRFGTRFPDMSDIYDNGIVNILLSALAASGLEKRSGIYAALCGPSYETPAEIQMLKLLGAHAVGMSTAPEAIIARHMGVKVGGISCITNMAAGVSKKKLTHNEVEDAAKAVKNRFSKVLHDTLYNLT